MCLVFLQGEDPRSALQHPPCVRTAISLSSSPPPGVTSSATNYFCGKPAPRAALPGTSTLVAPWPHRRSPHDAISAQLNASAAAPRPAPCPAPPRRCPGVGAQAAPARPSPKGPERGLQVERSGSAIRPGCRGSVPGLPGWLRASGLPAAFCEKPRGEVPPHTPCVCVCVQYVPSCTCYRHTCR